jgi:predicted RNA-binding protein with PUA-like domain
MRYWLMKSEPDVYSYADLERDRTTFWDGVRNFQARNSLRDDIKLGDGVLYYHSNSDPTGIAGIAKVVREGYPDPTQFEAKHAHYDPTADPADPRWYMVDIEAVKPVDPLIPLEQLKAEPGLEKMVVNQKGSRLSVQPVTEAEWQIVLAMSARPRVAASSSRASPSPAPKRTAARPARGRPKSKPAASSAPARARGSAKPNPKPPRTPARAPSGGRRSPRTPRGSR